MKFRSLALALPIFLAAAAARAGDGAGEPAPNPAPAAAASADSITLKDGRRLEGEIVGEDDRFVSLKSGGVTRMYAKDSIASIDRAARAPGRTDGSAGPGAAPGQTPAAPPGKEKKKDRGDRRDAPLSAAANAWLTELLARTADSDEAVRRSIGAAIGALGPQAIPAVRAAQAAAPDGPKKQFLDKLASEMEARRDRKPKGEPGMPGDGMRPGAEQGMPPGTRPGPARRGAGEELLQRLSTELELRDDQKPKVEAIVQDAMKKRFELFREARRDGLTAEQVAERVAPLRTDLLSQMKAVLDEPQYAMFEEMANRLFEMQRGGPPMPGRPAEGGQPKPPEPAPQKDDQPK